LNQEDDIVLFVRVDSQQNFAKRGVECSLKHFWWVVLQCQVEANNMDEIKEEADQNIDFVDIELVAVAKNAVSKHLNAVVHYSLSNWSLLMMMVC
jgi:hypothetical protein